MPRTASPGKSNTPYIVIGVVIGALALVATIVMVAMQQRPAPPDETAVWEAEHRQEISRLNDDAETLALQGDLKEAHGKYQQLGRVVAGRQIRDTALAAIVATAQRNQDRVYQKLLALVPSLAPPAPESIAQPATVPSPAPDATAAAPASMPAVADESRQPAPSQFLGVPAGPLSDQQIGEAIQRGVDFLLSQFKDGQYQPSVQQLDDTQRQGADALCVYALAMANKAIFDPRLNPKSPEMSKILDALKSYPLPDGGANPFNQAGAVGVAAMMRPNTYTHALRACALAAFNRPQDRKALQLDMDWLIAAESEGSYTYGKWPTINHGRNAPHAAEDGAHDRADNAPVLLAAAPVVPSRPPFRPPIYQPPPPPTRMPQGFTPPNVPPLPDHIVGIPWDNSNSQYGLLGVWAGAEAGIEVPTKYWRDVESHWINCQLPSGEWGYTAANSKPAYSMTCAGVASLLVTHDYLDAPLLGRNLAPRPYSPNLQKAIDWLEVGDHSIDFAPGMWFPGYSLYGIERVGLASGYKYFGEHNWFVELARRQLPMQQRNGSFLGTETAIETAYMLLFLSRGRYPIIANKLRFDGSWTNRPRDLSNLATYVSHEMERPVNWQVVDAKRNPEDWADAPILYIASQKALKFDDELVGKLAAFVANGGIIFTHADANSVEFTQSVQKLTAKLFPSYPLLDLPANHALYTLNYKISTPRPRLQGVSNGYRLLWVHSPSDLSDAWQTRSASSRKEPFQVGANLYIYATGKEKARNRLDTPIIPPPDVAPVRTVALARLKHAANWNPEPGAWTRFGRKLQWESGVQLKIMEMPIAELTFAKCPIAHLTATDALTLSDAELSACRTFVESGGTLLIDAAGGSAAFTDSATPWLSKLLGATPLVALEPANPLLHHTIDDTVEVPTRPLRTYALERLGTNTTRVQSRALGKGRVIFSSCDIATGLLGTNTWGVLGYLPEYSEALVKNIVLSAVH